MSDKVRISSEASVLIGGKQIASFDDGSSEARVAAELWEPTAEELLGNHRWRFATRQVQLSRKTAAPDTIYAAAYALPAWTTVVHGVLVRDHPIEFDRYGDELQCDAAEDDVVIAILGFDAPVTSWPPYFKTAMRLKLASIFAIALAENETKANIFEGKFTRAWVTAKTLDSQGRTAQKLPVGGLARYHGGRP